MSKYNLTEIFEEMSTTEKERFDRLSKDDQDKLKKIMDMMAKEKSMKEDKYDDIVDADDDIPADEKKAAAAAYRKVDKGASYEKATSHIKEDNIEEMTGEIYNRIDSLIDQKLKMEFIDKFIALQDDLIEAGDEFDKMDLIDYLATELQKFGARNFEEGKNNKVRPGYNADGTPKSNDEMSDDEREAFYNDSNFIDEDESLKEHFGRFMKDYQ